MAIVATGIILEADAACPCAKSKGAHPGRVRPGLHDASDAQCDDLSLDLVSAEVEPPHAYRQLESPRASTAGIEIKHAGPRLLLGNMAMAGDHHAESSGFGFEVERRKIVQHVDGNAVYFEHFRLRQLARPGTGIDVATHGGDWCNCGKSLQNFGCADIARVNDAIRPAKRFNRFGPKQAVSVGDDADEDGRSQFSFLSSARDLDQPAINLFISACEGTDSIDW
jgi:hypothetical protein